MKYQMIVVIGAISSVLLAALILGGIPGLISGLIGFGIALGLIVLLEVAKTLDSVT